MLKSSSFQNKLFIYYSILVIIIIIIVTVIFSIYISSLLRDKTESNLKDRVGNVSTQLDSMVLALDTISTQVVFSKSIQEILTEALEYNNAPTNFFDFNYSSRNKAHEVLLSINSPKDTTKRICIFNNESNFISVGKTDYDLETVNQNIKDSTWLNEVIMLNGKFLLLPPHKDSWTKPNEASVVVSLSRTINSTYGVNNILGIVEVQQPYSMIEKICNINDKNYQSKLLVLDEKGNIIYPYASISSLEGDYYLKSTLFKSSEESYSLKNPFNHATELTYFMKSQLTGWITILTMQDRAFMTPVYTVQMYIYIAGFILILLSLLAMLVITNSLTAPIRQLRKLFKEVSLENPTLNFPPQSGNNEIELLGQAFNETMVRFKQSVHQTIQAKESELEAHFLAFQSQMSPHFLFNSLTGISAAGQEVGSNKIVAMCSCLSGMLRYVASYKNSSITLGDELEHAENYLKLIKFRFEERIDYQFIIDDAIFDIITQKHILQPIIENIFSHGYKNVRPPWKISIKGTVLNNRWTIAIEDNGIGFSESSIEEIKTRMKELDESLFSGNIIQNLEVGGMALPNIYIRLKMLYQNKTVFEIRNNPQAGSTVTIGGSKLNARKHIENDKNSGC